MKLPPTVLLLPLYLAALVLGEQYDPRVEMFQAFWKDFQDSIAASGSVAVSIQGTTIFHDQVGVAFPSADSTADDPQFLPPDSETQYRIGSITKMFTSVMILQLVEEGKLTLETPLSTFFPNVVKADRITIRQLLQHRSGIHNPTDDPEFYTYFSTPQTREQMLARIEALPSDFEPGTQSSYSNAAFILLGYIIEDLTQNTYADELEKRITNVLDLPRTAYMTPPNVEDNVAFSFVWDRNNTPQAPQWVPFLNATDPSVPHGAGSIMSTASDVTMFLEGLFGGKLLNDTSLQAMTDIDNDGFGLGVFLINYNSTLSGLGHTGGVDAFVSVAAYFPEQEVAMALISNGVDPFANSTTLNDVVIGLLDIAFGKNATIGVEDTENNGEEEDEDQSSSASNPVDVDVLSGASMWRISGLVVFQIIAACMSVIVGASQIHY